MIAYFFRRIFNMLSFGGTFGLLATKTVAQGDTREGGLAWISDHGGVIYEARKRVVWPGEAAVIVSIVHLSKRHSVSTVRLDGRTVASISAYLVPGSNNDSPKRLGQNLDGFSMGMYPYGSGFMFDDADEEATTLDEMRRICKEDPRCAARIRPYIGGEEILSDPRHMHRRWVICMSDLDDADALRAWPSLENILRTKVKPFREGLGDNPNNKPLKKRWWAFQSTRPRLTEAMVRLRRVLVHPNVSANLAFVFIPTTTIVASPHNVFLRDDDRSFAVLQSRVHETWARFFGSSMKDDLRYTPSDCFETFPFPSSYEESRALEAIARSYYEFRAALMIKNDEGLTKTYNRFRDREEQSPDIVRLRELHAQMDRAVLDAYGWTEIKPVYDFREQLDESLRLTWTDETRDDVLARLLELNRVRAEQESKMAPKVDAKAPKKTAKKKGKADETTEKLFGEDDG